MGCEEWRNDTQCAFWNVCGVLDKYDINELRKILIHDEHGGFGTAGRFLNALVRDGFIEAGNYLVTISW